MNNDFLNQDLCYPLFQWFASKPDARRLVRERVKEIEMRTPNKSEQKRQQTRAPHGSPDYPARIGAWVTEEQYQYFHKHGGSIWLREVLEQRMKGEKK